MTFSKQAWDQLRNLTADALIRALDRDGWALDTTKGSIQVYRRDDGRRVAIHYHPQKTFGRKLLAGLLNDIGWAEGDLRRLKLIK